MDDDWEKRLTCVPCPRIDDPWHVQILWRGPELTLKEAALLRQFLPGCANESIQELRDQYRGTPGWTGRRLPLWQMRELRSAAEARGFKVVTEVETRNVPRLRLPRPGGILWRRTQSHVLREGRHRRHLRGRAWHLGDRQ